MTGQLSDDDREIAECPPGYQHTLIMVAILKYALSFEMTAAQRLDLLEKLNGLPDGYVSTAAVAAVQPACATFAQIVLEAGKLEVATISGGWQASKC
jgi:hypothetical protein